MHNLYLALCVPRVRAPGKHNTLPVLLGEKLIEQKVKTNELVSARKVQAKCNFKCKLPPARLLIGHSLLASLVSTRTLAS